MKKILFIALLLSTGISGQESKIDSLENEIKNIDEQIKSLNNAKRDLNSAILIEKQKKLEFEAENGFESTVGVIGGALWTSPDWQKAESIMRLKSGEKVLVFEFANEEYVRVKYNDINAYMTVRSLVNEGKIQEKFNAMRKESNPRLAKLIDVYGEQDGYRVFNKIIAIGMTKSMVRDAIGNPTEINRNQFEWGTADTWYYKRGYDTYKIIHFRGQRVEIISDY